MKSFLKWLLIAAVFIVGGFAVYGAVLYLRVKDQFKVSSDSMAPALITGDVFEIDRDAYRTRKPEAGEIVVYKLKSGEGSQAESPIMVFRVVAGPGDRVVFPKGKLFVNENPVEATLIEKNSVYEMYEEKINNRRFKVTYLVGAQSFSETPALMGESDYFVIGDNRDNAADSRRHGPIQLEQIIGRAAKIIESSDPKRIGMEL